MKYAWRMNRQKSTFLILLILILSVSRLFGAFQVFGTLYSEMSGNVNLYCSISGADSSYISQIRGLAGVSYVSAYYESSHTLSYNDYSIQVNLVGCEGTYLQERYSESIFSAVEGAMPYIIFDESVLSAMTNDKGEMLEVDTPEDFVLQNFELDSIKTRLCGITRENLEESEDSKSNVFYVYTTLDGYETLTGSKHAAASVESGLSGDLGSDAVVENANKSASSESVEENTSSSTPSYLIILKNGFYLNQTLDIFTKNGITYAFDSENDLQTTWKNRTTQGWQLLELSMVMILSALLITYYQGQLWRLKHRPFLCYLSQFAHYKKTLRRMMAGRILCLAFISIPCGFVLFWMGI